MLDLILYYYYHFNYCYFTDVIITAIIVDIIYVVHSTVYILFVPVMNYRLVQDVTLPSPYDREEPTVDPNNPEPRKKLV